MWAVYHALHCFNRGSSLKDAVRCRWSLDMRQGSQMHVCLFVCKTHNLQNRTSCPGLALKRISAASTTKLQQTSQAKFRRRWRPGFKIWMTRLMNRLSMTQHDSASLLSKVSRLYNQFNQPYAKDSNLINNCFCLHMQCRNEGYWPLQCKGKAFAFARQCTTPHNPASIHPNIQTCHQSPSA